MPIDDPVLDDLPCPAVRRTVAPYAPTEDSNPGRSAPSPSKNRFVVGIASASVVDDEELDALQHAADPLSDPWRAVLDARFAAVLERTNSQHFNFDLRALHEQGGPRLETLGSDSPIRGLTADRSTRKVALVLPLRVSGGPDAPRIRFPHSGQEVELTPGTLVLFPAFLVSEVIVERGATVEALVTYGVGPSFR